MNGRGLSTQCATHTKKEQRSFNFSEAEECRTKIHLHTHTHKMRMSFFILMMIFDSCKHNCGIHSIGSTSKTWSYLNGINFVVSRLTLATTAWTKWIFYCTQCLNSHDRKCCLKWKRKKKLSFFCAPVVSVDSIPSNMMK